MFTVVTISTNFVNKQIVKEDDESNVETKQLIHRVATLATNVVVVVANK